MNRQHVSARMDNTGRLYEQAFGFLAMQDIVLRQRRFLHHAHAGDFVQAPTQVL